VTARERELLGILRSLEWVMDDDTTLFTCPACHGIKPGDATDSEGKPWHPQVTVDDEGHAEDCRLAQALLTEGP
jgi:hypothetical protein